ncbi:MAG: hypothetical protein WC319_04470 [Candidatus Paceibacterota bacterium]|jgi:hypothetical protein
MQEQQQIIRYTLLEKKINKLLVKYGAGKLAVLLDNLSESIDDTALVAIEKLFSICAKGFNTNKTAIITSNKKGDKAVAARRAAVYIMYHDMGIEEQNIRSLVKLTSIYRVDEIKTYTEKCLCGEIVNKEYIDKFNPVRSEFLKELEILRQREYDEQNAEHTQNLTNNE